MDFFGQQDRARRSTLKLVVLFVLGVIAILTAINLTTTVALAFTGHRPSTPSRRQGPYINRDVPPSSYVAVYGWVNAVTLLVIFGGSLYKTAQLAQGGSVVAEMMGGRPIRPDADAREKQLQNVVEEMSIASGVPVPAIYVMDGEAGINAFAAGLTPRDAVIGVTRGCIETLNRDELQGVIAHEFSHILNGDMRLNLRLIGILHGILLIGLIGYGIVRYVPYVDTSSSRRSRDDKGGNGTLFILALGVAAIVIGYVGVFFGRLIQAAVSRQREYLADASAVQFTRNPAGLAGALKKIGRFSSGSSVQNASALEVSHLFFASAFRVGFTGLLATHPPLKDRIKALDPTFNAELELGAGASDVLEHTAPGEHGEPLASMLGAATGSRRTPRTRDEGPIPLEQEGFADRAGDLTEAHVAAAGQLLDAIPDDVKIAAHDPFSARAVIFALLISAEPSAQAIQLEILRRSVDSTTFNDAQALVPMLGQLGIAARLPILDLCLPALRQLSASQIQPFRAVLKALIEADRKVTLFEYCLFKIIRETLRAAEGRPASGEMKYFSIQPLIPDIAVVLAALAYSGKDESTGAASYRAGLERLGVTETSPATSTINFPQLDEALTRLDAASPAIKRRAIDAAAFTVAADGIVQVEEAELLRAISATLDVPMPVVQ